MKLFFLFLFSAFSISFANAQGYYTVSGVVLNGTGGAPLKDASVFAQNTTLGTVTAEDGTFKLQLPQGGYELAITYTGFQTETIRINSGDAAAPLRIILKEKESSLAEVSVVSSNEVPDGLAKYGSFFRDAFIGRSANSANCVIQNPEVLKFFFSKRRNRLKITATEPLIVKNSALGYNIRYTLDSFTHEYNTSVSTYAGYPLFEEMESTDPAQKQNWEKTRREAYRGSVLQFMRSMYEKALKENGFELQFLVKTNGKDQAIKVKDPYAAMHFERDDSTQTVSVLPNQANAGIIYAPEKPAEKYLEENNGEPDKFQFSVLTFKPGETVVIERNGYFYDQNDIAISGYWTWEKVADQLPYDYRYFEE